MKILCGCYIIPDLTPILESKISGCGFESRGHYSHTWSKLHDLLKAKYGEK